MAYTEFYCNYSIGSNLNAGTDQNASYRLTYVGDWDATTGILNVGAGDPAADGLLVGEIVSVCTVASVFAPFLGRITAISGFFITVSLTAKAGTPPTTGVRQLRAGGSWKGPNGAEDFPFGMMVQACNDGVNLTPRVNLIGAFTITGSISHNVPDAGPVIWKGHGSTFGDGGQAIIQNLSISASFVMLTLGSSSCRRQWIENVSFPANGVTGTATSLILSSVIGGARNVFVKQSRGAGFNCSGSGSVYIGCEAYQCNSSGSVNIPGIFCNSNSRWIRCSSIGNSQDGFDTTTAGSLNPILENCIAFSNGAAGYVFRSPTSTAGSSMTLFHCDSCGNGQDGLLLNAITAGGLIYLENCNFVDNGLWGVRQVDALNHTLFMRNCGFGAGSYANSSGNLSYSPNTNCLVEDLTVNYPDDKLPWVDVSGNFTAAGVARRAAYARFAANSQIMSKQRPTRDLAAIQGPGNPDTFIARPSVLIRR